MDTSTVGQIALLAGSTVVALFLGYVAGRHRSNGNAGSSDWKMRLAARDRDLAEAADRLIEAELALQTALQGTHQGSDPESRARIDALTEELADAEDELTRLRSLGVHEAAAEGTLARRLETLEAELATLESLRCPDPAAHRRRHAAEDLADDLTRITGVGQGLARILHRLGYRTFDDVTRMTDGDFQAITEAAGGTAGPSSREAWVQSAERLAAERTDAA